MDRDRAARRDHLAAVADPAPVSLERIVIHVNGRPAPKGSRIQGRTKTGKAYTYPASKYEAPWIKTVADQTRLIMLHTPQPEPPYAVELAFFVEPPQSKQGRLRMKPWPSASDLDKLTRAVLDGLVKGGAISDDRHVIELMAGKQYADDPDQTGVSATIISMARPG